VIKAIFFDVGGTLVTKANFPTRDLNVIAKIAELVNETCTPHELAGKILNGEREYKSWRSRSFIELPLVERWTRFLLPDLPAELVKRNAEQLQNLWSESRGKKHIPAETVSTVEELDKRGYLLGTISHTSPKYLAAAGILPLFKTIIHASKFGWRKPHPAPFLAAAKQSGVLPEECAYVGDKPSRDVVGAREAGFGMVIQLMLSTEPPEGDPCPMHPDFLIRHLGELLDLFPGLAAVADEQPNGKTEPLLYDASISSMWWNKETNSINEFLERGRKLGFPRFELNHQTPPEAFAQIDLDRYHIGALHDPCPAIIPAKTLEKADQVITSTNEVLRQRAVDGVKNTIDEAYRLAARHVVIHPGRIAGDHSMDDQLRELYRNGLKGTDEYEELRCKVMADRTDRSKPHMAALIKSLHEIIAFADGKGLTLGLENRYHYYELPVFGEMDTLLGEFKQEWVGWQFDIGHLQVLTELGVTTFDPWLERFGRRIVGVHLHDVKGITDHQSPGKGEVDFKKIAAALPPFCYCTLEVDKSLTELEIAAGLKVLAETGCIKLLSGGSDNA